MSNKKISPFLIFLVFIIFISLGLPDSIMGSAWPAIRETYGFSVDLIGILSAIMLGFSLCSTLIYPRLSKIWSMDKFIIYSTLLTIIGLIALSLGHTIFPILLACVLLGFGQGSIDIVINDFAAKHFTNSLMNFLHAFYGVGISASSFIMTFAVQPGQHWQLGVLIITVSQLAILFLAFFNRAKFAKEADSPEFEQTPPKENEPPEKLSLRHFLLPSFYFFYAVEVVIGRFYSSYAVEHLHLSMTTAAAITSFYWSGLTVGRFLTGFTAQRLSSKAIVILHVIFLIIGSIMGFFPFPLLQYVSGLLLGLGLAPLYPLVMKSTYEKYSAPLARRIISLNMTFVMAGMLLFPIFLGFLFEELGFSFYPLIIAGLSFILIILLYCIYKKDKK